MRLESRDSEQGESVGWVVGNGEGREGAVAMVLSSSFGLHRALETDESKPFSRFLRRSRVWREGSTHGEQLEMLRYSL